MEHINRTSGEQKYALMVLGKDKEPAKEKERKMAVEKENKPKHSTNEDNEEHKHFMQIGIPQESSGPDSKDPTDQKHWRTFILQQKLQNVENTHILYRVRFISFISFFCLIMSIV